MTTKGEGTGTGEGAGTGSGEGKDKDKGTGTGTGTGEGTGADKGTGKGETTFTQEDLAREVDRRVYEAQKKWKTDLDAILAQKDKDAETKLSDVQSTAAEASSRAAFMEKAVAEGVTDIKAAYVVAKEYKYWDGEKLDVESLRKNHPGLFEEDVRTAAREGGATGKDGPKTVDDFIRGTSNA